MKIFSELDELPGDVCIARINPSGNSASCDKKTVITDVAEPVEDHNYLLKTADVSDGLAVSISHQILHPVRKVERIKNAIVNGAEVRYGVTAFECIRCSYRTDNTAYYDEVGNVDLVRIIEDGREEIAILGDMYSEGFGTVDKDYTDIINTPIKLNYIVVDDVYVPLEYVDAETLKKIVDIELTKRRDEARREIAELVINELRRKGFVFKIDGRCGAKYDITIESPDGRRGELYADDRHGDATFIGELSVLAMTYCTYYEEFEQRKAKRAI